MAGQINRGSDFGEELYKLAKNTIFHNFVEIGTWNGQGSTKCIVDGIQDREKSNATLWSVESHIKFYNQAVHTWKGNDFPILKLLYGRIIEIEDLVNLEEYVNSDAFEEGYDKAYIGDMEGYVDCPNVLDQLPDKIDVLLLDGGEFSTKREFELLKDRARVIALDDTKCMKTRWIREQLLNDSNWKVFKDVLNDRNGYAIFIRRNNG